MQHRRPTGAASPAKTSEIHVSAPVLAGEDKIDQDDLFCRRVNRLRTFSVKTAVVAPLVSASNHANTENIGAAKSWHRKARTKRLIRRL